MSTALTFGWLGMVLAISFLEAPLKFRAPGVSVQIGLGIGRLVFRALNAVEIVLALVILAALARDGHPPAAVVVAALTSAAVLAVQVGAVRPALSRRTARVLAGETGARSRAHHAYIALECAKVISLLTLGILLLDT